MTDITSLCINLAKDTERHTSVLVQAERENINIEFVEGVYGKTLSATQRKQNTTPLWNRFGHPSVIGCAMSHLKCWKIAQERNLDYCIIFEDDVQLQNNFVKKVDAVMEEINGTEFDILYLGSRYFEPDKPLSLGWYIYKSIVSIGSVCKRQISEHVWEPELALGLHAYMLSRKGYNKLIQVVEGNISFHIDYQVQRIKNLSMLAVWEPIAYQTPTFGTSNLANQPFPQTYNKLIDNPIEHQFSAAYILNCPIAQIYGQNINYWTLIVLTISAAFIYFDVKFYNLLLLFFLFLFVNFIFMKPSETMTVLPESISTIAWMFLLLFIPSLFKKSLFG